MLGTRIALTVDYGKAGIPTPQKPCGFVGYELPVYGDIADILRPAVIICPGGAYSWISDREGEPVAEVFEGDTKTTYVKLTAEKVKEIVEKHIKGGKVVEAYTVGNVE